MSWNTAIAIGNLKKKIIKSEQLKDELEQMIKNGNPYLTVLEFVAKKISENDFD